MVIFFFLSLLLLVDCVLVVACCFLCNAPNGLRQDNGGRNEKPTKPRL